MPSEFDTQNPRKCGRKEPPPPNCPLIFTRTTVRNKENLKILIKNQKHCFKKTQLPSGHGSGQPVIIALERLKQEVESSRPDQQALESETLARLPMLGAG